MANYKDFLVHYNIYCLGENIVEETTKEISFQVQSKESKFQLQSDEIQLILKNHLKIESKVMSIETLLGNPRMRNKIIYDPYYQRNYVWDSDKATYFIESILLGTEIPPLVFFKADNGKIEVIDGRQRYETLSKFLNGNLALSKKGLTSLKALHKKKYTDLDDKIRDIYLDTKIRIIEFSIVNEPKLTDRQEDLIKKEIFRRYNSGITPLTTVDINRAIYNDDDVTNYFKSKLKADDCLNKKIIDLFFNADSNRKTSIDTILNKIRQLLVLHRIPVKYYSRSNNRQFIIENLYEIFTNQVASVEEVYEGFVNKILIIDKFKAVFCYSGENYNKLISECLLWALYICDVEELKISIENPIIYDELSFYIKKEKEKFTNVESHFYKNYEPRYEYVLKFFEKLFDRNLSDTYINSSNNFFKESKEKGSTDVQIEELKKFRLDKAEPSSTTIEDLTSQMMRKKFIIRPSYQREEVINLVKSSSIIESILLDIKLPPIFIFKRKDGISEVIDGQQRLLTILAYIGQGFCDENGHTIYSKKNNFKLKELKVLDELNGSKFEQLISKQQDKIYDFNLSVVTIDEERNSSFNPIDLFIRLNNKPYPVRENTFEMWNSYIDKQIITQIKQNQKKNEEWMYFRKNNSRMINEEMYAILAYLSYKNIYEKIGDKDIFNIYQRGTRINFRISNKRDITKVLELSSNNEEDKKKFISAVENVEIFIKKMRLILISENMEKDKSEEYLKNELSLIFQVKENSTRRSLQDFYALWYIIQPLNYEMVRMNRDTIKNELKEIFLLMKNSPDNSLNEFLKKLSVFINKYQLKNAK